MTHLADNGAGQRLIEVVGVAGAGKTALIGGLCDRNAAFVIGDDIRVRRMSDLVQFLRATPAIAARYAPGDRGRAPSWEEIKSLAYLARWREVLAAGHDHGSRILLDQGPIFRLATLHAFGPSRLQEPAAAQWWDDAFRRWSTLALVVWLDAPDHVLARRINTRAQAHVVKEKPRDQIVAFLRRYRASYEHVMNRLLAVRPFPVLRFDTGRTATAAVVDAVVRAFEPRDTTPSPEGLATPPVRRAHGVTP